MIVPDPRGWVVVDGDGKVLTRCWTRIGARLWRWRAERGLFDPLPAEWWDVVRSRYP